MSNPPVDAGGKDNKVDGEAEKQGLLRSAAAGLTSHAYTLGTSALWLGVGTVKWAASTTYNVGTGVVTKATGIVRKSPGKDKSD